MKNRSIPCKINKEMRLLTVAAFIQYCTRDPGQNYKTRDMKKIKLVVSKTVIRQPYDCLFKKPNSLL